MTAHDRHGQGGDGAPKHREDSPPPELTSSDCGGLSPETPIGDVEVMGLDFETTGLSAWRGDEVCEVGLVRASPGRYETVLSEFVDPGKPIPAVVQEITGIRDEDVAGSPPFRSTLPRLLDAIGGLPLVIHNAPFDLAFLQRGAEAFGLSSPTNLAIDTLLVARYLNQGKQINSLGHVARRLGIDRGRSHRATDDARAAAEVYFALVPELETRGLRTVGDLVRVRIAAPVAQLVAAPSSVVLDMLSRAISQGGVVEFTYSRAPGSDTRRCRMRPVEMVGDRELVGDVLGDDPAKTGRRRDFRIGDILTLDFEGNTFWSPWSEPRD